MAPLAPGPLATSQRAALRRALQAGLQLQSLVRGDSERIGDEQVALAMTVRDLLRAYPPTSDWVGPVCARSEIDPGTRLGDLTISQRLALAGYIHIQENQE